jgi:uncharacterized protein
MTTNEYFWETTPLKDLTKAQWEALCDGCGRCCLQKLENKKTGKVYFTAVACRLLDLQTCRCRNYEKRHQVIKDCLQLSHQNVYRPWLPKSCAYRRLTLGKKLDWWHPLISEDSNSVHEAGISIRSMAISELYVPLEHLDEYIIKGNGF